LTQFLRERYHCGDHKSIKTLKHFIPLPRGLWCSRRRAKRQPN